jgi:hypothetical protein
MNGIAQAHHRRRYLLAAGLLCGVAAFACSDDDDITNVVPQGVAVFKDSTFNFNTLNTFAMPDTVVHFNPVTGTPLEVTRQYDAAILNQVRQNFLARGYTQVANPITTRPSFVALVGATATQNYDAFVTYSFYPYYGYYTGWGWYTPGFSNNWGLAFPWYATTGVTAYDRGTVVVTIVPTLSVNPLGQQITASWAGVASGVLNGDITQATVTGAIDQMFVLSPYLVAGPLP